MGLSAAERQRRFRERRDANPERRAQWLAYKREKYQADKRQGKRKLVKDMTRREHRIAKKNWRKDQSKRRQRLHELKNQETETGTSQSPGLSLSAASPPWLTRRRRSAKVLDKKVQDLKQRAADLERQLHQQKKKTWLYEKRLNRLAQSKHDNVDDTPRKRARKTLKKPQKIVNKTLVFHYAMMDQIKRNYKRSPHQTKSILAHNTVTSADSVLRKYGFKTKACKHLGIFPNTSKERKGCLQTRVRISVRIFFERDDVSRILSGKRCTVTRRKVKKQKRFLCDTLRNLYLKYLAETLENISFTTFYRLKPFWVTYPTSSERKTCLCKTCENFKLKADCLLKHNVIDTAITDFLVGQLVCSKDNKHCMYRNCKKCRCRRVSGVVVDAAKEVSWFQWKIVRTERIFRNGEKKMVNVTVKELQTATLGELWETFQENVDLFCRHTFNITNQHRHLKNLRQTMPESECIVHVDFSENYLGKMHREVQSVHFGVSQVPITLHTGCYYLVGREKPVLFCGVSDSLKHDPPAVWAFLKPVLEEIRIQNPQIEKIHFFSDGPTTQYRQKKNFYLLSTEVFKMGFSGATWNFFAAGHGKGTPDGVGATLKRTADRKVLQGSDIQNSTDFIQLLEPCTSIKLYRVDENDIADMEEPVRTKTLKTVPGTMKLHQVVVISPEQIRCRQVSCLCAQNQASDHDHQQDVDFSFTPFCSEKSKQNMDHDTVRHKTGQQSFSKNESRDRCSETIPDSEKERHFINHLNVLQTATSFTEFQDLCRKFDLGNSITGTPRYINQDRLSVDHKTLKIYPSDITGPKPYPVIVRADGNCLPGCGSVFEFGHDGRPAEIRTRVVHELALHQDHYLNEENLKRT